MIEKSDFVQSLQALAHEARLEVFLSLVEAGPDGLSAGALARRLDMAPSALSFHLTRLRYAGLIQSRRQGQRLVYSAVYEQVEALAGFLTAHCCRGSVEGCEPVCGGQQRADTPAVSRQATRPRRGSRKRSA